VHSFINDQPDTMFFSVCLKAINAVGKHETCYIIKIPPRPEANEENVVADFSFTMSADTSPVWVQFTNLSQYALSYFWSFGDGITSEESNPEHTYYNNGAVADKFLIELHARGANDIIKIKTSNIVIQPLIIPPSRADILCNPNGWIVYNSHDSLTTNGQTFNLMNSGNSCFYDNTTIYTKITGLNGPWVMSEGPTKRSPSDPQVTFPGFWEFIGSDQIRIKNDDLSSIKDWDIEHLSDSLFILSYEFNDTSGLMVRKHFYRLDI